MGAAVGSMITAAGITAALTSLGVEAQLVAVACLGIFGGIWAVKKLKSALI